MWKDVYADFTDLPKHEQQKLFNLIKEEFFSDIDEEVEDALLTPLYLELVILVSSLPSFI